MDLCPRLHRPGHQADLDQLHFGQRPRPGALGPPDPVAEAQAAHRSFLQKHRRLAPGRALGEPGDHPEAAPVLPEIFDPPDRPRRRVLPQQGHARRAALQRARERAGSYDIAAPIRPPENGGIAGEPHLRTWANRPILTAIPATRMARRILTAQVTTAFHADFLASRQAWSSSRSSAMSRPAFSSLSPSAESARSAPTPLDSSISALSVTRSAPCPSAWATSSASIDAFASAIISPYRL